MYFFANIDGYFRYFLYDKKVCIFAETSQRTADATLDIALHLDKVSDLVDDQKY